jgi:hypothetical protein
MSARFKPYLLIIIAILLATFFLNAPVACATKLAKACNVFDQHQVKKDGSCQALLPDQNSFDDGIWSPYIIDLDASASVGNLYTMDSLPRISSANFYSPPIRC